jgi:hypothetical protein
MVKGIAAAAAISVAAVRLEWWSGVFCIKSGVVLAFNGGDGKSFFPKT